MEKKIEKIVLTGGPCAGKTTAQSWIQSNLEKMGYTVLFVPESATELIGGGVLPGKFHSIVDYELLQMQIQTEKEKVFELAAEKMDAEKVLIVCDRGQMDSKAYMSESEFDEMVQAANTSTVSLRDTYGAIFHLVTAAKGAAEFYTLENNAARTETPEQAAALDDRLIAAWTGHPHLRIIDNATDFQDKMRRLMKEISVFLGEPEPLEIERKFLVSFPDLETLEKLPACRKVEIIQTYLQSPSDREVRIRQRGENGYYVYTLTEKRQVSAMKRVEVERRLTQAEYLEKLLQADTDTSCRQIRKTRYCMTVDGKYFELDIFPFWKDKALLELELADEQEEVRIPEFLKVIREVTDDPEYRNSAIARNA